MTRTGLNKEGILPRLVTPRRLIEAGTLVASFAVPTLILIGDARDGMGPAWTLKEALIFIGAIGGSLGIPLVVMEDTFLRFWELMQKHNAKNGAITNGAALDAGVPVVGTEEINE